MFRWSATNSNSREFNSNVGTSFGSEGSYHSILRNTKGKKKTKKKNKIDRNVTWSKEFQTYEERSPISFDSGYDDDDYSFKREETFDDDESLIADYLLDHSVLDHSNDPDIARFTTTKKHTPSSLFTPLDIPMNFNNALSEDDASLIETMSNYYDNGLSKAASDDNSIVSLERIHDISRQPELDSNFGHLGLVMPTIDGLLNVLGVGAQSEDDGLSTSTHSSSSSIQSSYSERSDYTAPIASDQTKESKTKSIRNDGASPTLSKLVTKGKDAPKAKGAKKEKARSTAELNVAIQRLETNSSESTDSGIELKRSENGSVSVASSGSEDLIEPLFSDEVSEIGSRAAEEIKQPVGKNVEKKKKSSVFGFKNNQKSCNTNLAKSKHTVKKEVSGRRGPPTPDVSEKEVDSLVSIALARQKVRPNSGERSKMAATPVVAAGASEVRESFSSSTDGGSDVKENDPFSERKRREKKKSKKSLKNKLSFRRTKNSTILSGKELAFAYAQQQLAPMEHNSDHSTSLQGKASDESNRSGRREPKVGKNKKEETNVLQEETKGCVVTSKEKLERKKPANIRKIDDGNNTTNSTNVNQGIERTTKTTKANEIKKKQTKLSQTNLTASKTEKSITLEESTIVTKTQKEKVKQAKIDEKETISMRKDDHARKPQVTKEVRNPTEKVIFDLPEPLKKEAALEKTKEPQSNVDKSPRQAFNVDLDREAMREHLYNDILRASSFDSVSTTEDILYELQQIEDAAQKMYQEMLMKSEDE